MTELCLRDLGERRIIEQLLAPRYASNTASYGDDCAALPLAPGDGGHLVVTTDPCPPPMAAQLGFEDVFYLGWLLATINLSDLAAAGARPLGLLTSLQLPAETTVAEFERLLDGIDACCADNETSVLGGNLKESPQLDVAATAFGVCDTPPLTRTGAQSGDVLVILGDLGSFWAGVLGVRGGLLARDPSESLLRNVLTPMPKVRLGLAARQSQLLTACLDNSDGLYPSLLQLSRASGTRIVVEGEQLWYSPGVADMAARLGIEPLRLALGWGDWQLVCACRTGDFEALCQLADNGQTEVHRLGRIEAGSGVDLELRDEARPLLALDSQRFAADSWFSSGLDAYIDALLSGPLQQET